MLQAGIDIGYTHTKAMTDGQKSINFPSVVGTEYEVPFTLQDDGHGIKFLTPQRAVIGDSAITFSDLVTRREDRNWIASEDYYLLFLAALSELEDNSGTARVVTGLPLSYFEDRETLRERLQKVHTFQREGRSLQVINVEKVTVLPQPFGTLLDYCLDAQGKIIQSGTARSHIGVIDVGGKTTNFLHAYKLTEIPSETRSISVGGWKAIKLLRRAVEHEYRDLVLHDHELIEAMISKNLRYQGKTIDITPLIETISEQLARKIIGEASQLWESLGKFSLILLTGGGSLLLGEALTAYFPQAIRVEHPVFANCRGFWKYAQR